MGSPPRFEFFANASTKFLRFRRAAAVAASVLFLLGIPGPAAAQERASLVWRGESHPIAVFRASGFSVADAARALDFSVSRDETTGVLTLSGHGHRVVVGAGTSEVPVDSRVVSISRAVAEAGGVLYAPADFLEKVLFPLAGATGAYDAGKRLWALAEVTPAPLSLQVAVVHVAPTTQIVLRQSSPARFVPSLSEKGFQVRWPGQRVTAPFAERAYEDPFVSAIRFSSDAASIEFREAGLTARAYPLTAPDRVVVEVGRPAQAGEVTPPPAAAVPIVIVVDPGHGGAETGAIGPEGLFEKDFTLELARLLASTVPRVLASRVILTRDSDSAISLDDRTAVANHEKASIFLSLHANSSRSPGAHGSETYYLSLEASDKLGEEVARRENQGNGGPGSSAAASPAAADLDFILWDLAQSAHLKESSELAEAIQEELNIVSQTENRGIKQAPFRVLVGATMPAVLVEAAFISNAEEERKLKSAEFQQSVADAIARALGRFYALRKPEALRVPLPTPTPTPPPTRAPRSLSEKDPSPARRDGSVIGQAPGP